MFATSCASCHGTSGLGLPHQGPPLRDTPFITKHDDKSLVAFVRRGRTPYDAESIMKGSMPARGGVSNFNDNDLQDIIAHVRSLQTPATVAAVN
ncbi:MAG: cytochrome c [Tepidisphaeraceae bacterium]